MKSLSGPVSEFYDKPMLVQEGWACEQALDELVFSDQWGQRS